MKNKILITTIVLIFTLTGNVFLGPEKAQAATLQVGPGQTYTTIQACADVAAAGDTCLVNAGTYDEKVTVTNSGTAGSPIIFKANGNAIVRGFTIIGKNYITIDGFEVTKIGTSSSDIQVYNANTGVQILNNNIHHTTSACIGFGDSSFLTIRGNQISYCGPTTAYPGGGAAALQGLYNRPSTDVLVDQNSLSYASDYLIPAGSRFVYRNNTIGPADPANPIHIDGVQNNAAVDFVLMEGNRTVDNANSDNHFLLNSAAANNFIIRYNSSLRSKAMQQWGANGVNSSKFAHYNNTWYNTVDYYNSWTQIYSTNSTNNISRNNIWYRAVRDPGGNAYSTAMSVDKGYDLFFQTGNVQGTNSISGDPLFVGASTGDFSLQNSSPAINAGGALTTTTNAGASSSSVDVTNSFPFQDGWAGVTPDEIAIGSPTNHARISSISGNTINLASSLSWSAGDPVYLYAKSDGIQVLVGSAPDIGAFEYGAPSTPVPPPPAPTPPPTDTTAPIISNIASGSLTTSGATITWTTNESADTQIDYGTTTGYGQQTTLNSSLLTSHSQAISGLAAGTLYHYRVRSKDASGNLALSPDNTFTTSAVATPPPTVPPPVTPPTTPPPVTPPTTPPPAPTPVTPTPTPPPGSLPSTTISLINSNGTFYLIQNGKRHGITNPGMLTSYGFTFSDAKLATANDLALPEGPLLTPGDGSLVKSQEDQTVYLISGQKRYGFTSAQVFLDLGFKFSSVLVVTDPEMQSLPRTTNLDNSSAAHLPGLDINKAGTVYWVGLDNQLHAYPSLQIYNSWHVANDFSRIVPANAADLSLPIGGMVGERVKQ